MQMENHYHHSSERFVSSDSGFILRPLFADQVSMCVDRDNGSSMPLLTSVQMNEQSTSTTRTHIPNEASLPLLNGQKQQHEQRRYSTQQPQQQQRQQQQQHRHRRRVDWKLAATAAFLFCLLVCQPSVVDARNRRNRYRGERE